MTPGEREPETVVAELRSNVGVLVVPSIVLVVAVAGTGYAAPQMPETWQQWGTVAGAALVVVLAFVIPLWVWLSRRYTVTTRRTILRDGMLVRHRREVLHARVDEVTVRRTPWQAMGGSGDVILELGSGRNAVIKDVRSPLLVQAALTDLAEAQRNETATRSERLAQSGEQPGL